MTLRSVAREIREYPATVCFSLIWIVVFGAMVVLQLRGSAAPSWWRLLVRGIGDGHRFGDLTIREVARGEIWRLVTATFVHYSVIHLGLNLLAFYLLGTLLESWYGTPQFILIYGLTGGLGNLVSAIIKHTIGVDPLIHSAGGSVVVMGQIGLCAVVGWRSRTSMGKDLGWQMLKSLGLVALLGIVLHNYIDNWGHAGGAIIGLPLGFLHGWFIRQRNRPSAWGLGVLTGLVIAGCGMAQFAADRRESQARGMLTAYLERRTYYDINRRLGILVMMGEDEVEARAVIETFVKDKDILDHGETLVVFRRAATLAEKAQLRPLTREEQEEFDRCLAQISSHLLRELEPFFAQEVVHDAYNQLRALALEAESRPLTAEEKAQFRQFLRPVKEAVRRELEPRIRELWRSRAQRLRAAGSP
jgi:membrane associated rhomboid family serine protease